MAIKIPGAREVGIGRKTPGAIPAGTPRFVPEIDTGIGLELLQAGLKLAGGVVSAERAKAQKLEVKQLEEAKSQVGMFTMGLQGRIASESSAIARREDLDIAGKQEEYSSMVQKMEGEFTAAVPDALRLEFAERLKRTEVDVKLKFDNALIGQVNDKRIADIETGLFEIENWSAENAGFEASAKKQAHTLIATSPEKATVKADRRRKIDRVIDTNTVKNELVLGNPKIVLERLQAKTESGAYSNYTGLTSADRTAYTKQAREATMTNNGLEIANDVYDKHGPKGDKMALIDIEDMAQKAESRAGTTQAAKAAVTRIRERAILHNQGRTAVIKANQIAVWEAHDNGAKSGEIYKMPEFIELPAPERKAIRDELERIAESRSKAETFASKQKQIDRFDEINDNPAILEDLGVEGIRDERRAGKLTETDAEALEDMLGKGTLESEQSSEAYRRLASARDKEFYNSDDEIDNSEQYAAHKARLNTYRRNHPNANPLEFTREMLRPTETRYLMRLLEALSPFGATSKAPAEAKEARIRALEDKPTAPTVGTKPVISPKRQKAIDVLVRNGKPVTEGNINYVLERTK